MNLQIAPIKISDLEINSSLYDQEEDENEGNFHGNELQRTELWQEERRGNWTGSQFKNCMTCNAKGGRLDWFNNEKVYFFSEGALKYIFANAMERKTGRYIQSDSTKEMKYGTIIEPLIFRRAAEKLLESGLVLEKVGYKAFDEIPTAGVSSDAIVKREFDGQIVGSGEFKACASWSSLYDRTFDLMDEKGTDFWQTQGQMLAWDVEENYYVVASPPKDINVYLRVENIMDYYEEWCEETEITIQIIKKSPIHLNALKQRIQIMESTVNRWLEEDGNLKEILYEEIDFFKANREQKAERELGQGLIEEKKEISYDLPKELKQQENQFHVEPTIKVEVNFDDLPF